MPRKLARAAALPNLGSEHQTAASLMLDTHWAMMRLEDRWTWERFVRLANFLQLTVYELASLVMLRHKSIPEYQIRNGMCPGKRESRLTALFLQLVENHVMGAWDPSAVLDPFPHLRNLPRGAPLRPKIVRGPFGRPRKYPRSSAGSENLEKRIPDHARPEGS